MKVSVNEHGVSVDDIEITFLTEIEGHMMWEIRKGNQAYDLTISPTGKSMKLYKTKRFWVAPTASE